MPSLFTKQQADGKGLLEALDRSLAIIEFTPDGDIVHANENFCQAMGYGLADIKGRHHSLFVPAGYDQTQEYRDFWQRLGRGQYDASEYRRVARGGRDVWIQASYNPVKDKAGKVVKVVKVATDITAEKLRNAEFEAKLQAISRVQATIEFTPTGEILDANDNFLKTLGYSLDEIKGRHHRMFVEPAFAASSDYAEFWKKLSAGEYVATSFKRIGKGGKEVWIQASYNPILDLSGKVFKVVKFATDITDLTEIGAGLARLAANNLEQEIERPFSPDFQQLKTDFNVAHRNLGAALTQVVSGANALHAGAQEIVTASDDLARRTEQQAATLEETAAALDEITSTVTRSAEGAKEASSAASTARSEAAASSGVVDQAVRAMGEIEESSRQIGQIVGVIDEIAFQTNLLALNAGVEAARAGESGKGFAVVAQEVRALAQRSAEAAKEIKALISASDSHVQQGVQLVGATGDALSKIADRVVDIDKLIHEIARSSQEQTTGLKQVNTAVNQMDQVTQQNAAMVEQATAASHAMCAQADELTGLVGRFALKGADQPPVRRQQAELRRIYG